MLNQVFLRGLSIRLFLSLSYFICCFYLRIFFVEKEIILVIFTVLALLYIGEWEDILEKEKHGRIAEE